MFERQFIRRLVHPCLQAFLGFRAPACQPYLERINAWWFYKKTQGIIGELFLHMDGPFHVNIKHGYLSGIPDTVKLSFQGAIIQPLIHHLPFYELVVGYLLVEIRLFQIVIIYPVNLLPTLLSGGGRNGKRQERVFLQKIPCNGCLARPRRRRYDD